MARSIAGTRWLCKAVDAPHYGQSCTVLDGAAGVNAESLVRVRFEDGTELSMTTRRFHEQFDQPLEQFA